MTSRLQGPARRIAVAVAALVLLVTLAVGIAVWRYGAAIDSGKEARGLAEAQFHAQQVRTAITDEGGTADAYGGDADPADLADLATIKKSLAQALESLQQSSTLGAEGAAFVPELKTEQRHLESIFHDQVKPVAGTTKFRRRRLAL